jgi:hypothetical protein
MENLMPMIFTPPDMRTMGQQMSTAMLPMLNEMNEIMRRRTDQLSRLGFQTMTAVLGAMQNIRGLRPDVFSVQVLNLDFLELMAAGSFAFLVLIFLKLHDWFRISNTTIFQVQQIVAQMLNDVREMHLRLGDLNLNLQNVLNLTANISATLQLMLRAVVNFNLEVNARLEAILDALVNLNISLGGISLKLDDILRLLAEISGKLSLINQAIVDLTARLDAVGARMVGLLEAILAQLRAGIQVSGTVNLVVNITKTIGFDIGWGDLLKMLLAGLAAVLLLAAALAVLVGFVYLLGKVLQDFGLKAVLGMILALAALIAFVYLLRDAIKGFDLKQILLLALALGVLVIFVRELSRALKEFALGTVIGLVLALAGLAAFVYFLGKALQGFNKDVLAAIPQLDKLFDSLIKLANAIVNFSTAQLWQIAAGFAGIVVFLGLLGLVLRLFNADVLNALPGLAQLFDSLINLATAITSFTPDQLWQIAAGFLGIVAFLGLLSFALNNFNVDVLNALPALSGLFDSLIRLAYAIVSFTPDQLILIGIAMAALTAIMFGMAVALNIATPGLQALAAVLGNLERLFNSVANAASRASSVFSAVPSIGGVSFPSYQEGGVMSHTGLALLHAGERVLTTGETAALQASQSLPSVQPLPVPQAVDQSVSIQGGITVNINAERLDQAAAPQISEEIIRHLQERLGALRTEQDFRTGMRTPAPA